MKYLVVAFLSSVGPDYAADASPSLRKIITKIEDLGGEVTLEESPNGRRVVAVEYRGASATDDFLACLSKLSSIKELRLQDAEMTDSKLRHLAALTDLRLLDLSGTAITAAGLAHLKGLTRLEWLSLSDCKLDAAMFAAIKQFDRLEDLYLDGSEVDGGAIGQLKGLKKIRSLSLSFCTGVTESSLRAIGGFSDLASLDVSGIKSVAKDVKFLRGLPALRRLDIGVVATDSILAEVASLKNLRELSIDICPVSDVGIKSIASMRKLEVLVASGTKITDAGLRLVCKLVNLRILDVADTAVTDAGITCLSKLEHLESVTLPGKTVTKEAVGKLQRQLLHCAIIRGTLSFGPLAIR
jgi:Leucine-rich repeat (LRR) protein